MQRFDDADRSEEHVFPDSLGGTLKLFDLCVPCNSLWGRTVDAHLVNHHLCAIARFRHQIAGKSGTIPNPFREATLTADPNQRMLTGISIDGPSPPVFLEKVHYEEGENGHFTVHVQGDVTRRADLDTLVDKIEERQRKKGNIPTRKSEPTITRHEAPSMTIPIAFDVLKWRVGMLKIAYELAFIELGAAYLNDPTAIEIRKRLAAEPTLEQMDGLFARFDFGNLVPHMTSAHCHWGSIGLNAAGQVAVCVQIFDTLFAQVAVTEQPRLYPRFPGMAFYNVDAKKRTWDRISMRMPIP